MFRCSRFFYVRTSFPRRFQLSWWRNLWIKVGPGLHSSQPAVAVITRDKLPNPTNFPQLVRMRIYCTQLLAPELSFIEVSTQTISNKGKGKRVRQGGGYKTDYPPPWTSNRSTYSPLNAWTKTLCLVRCCVRPYGPTWRQGTSEMKCLLYYA